MHVTISTFDSVKATQATRETLDFEAFLEDFRQPLVESELSATIENVKTIKLSTPAFSPAVFAEDRRKKQNVEAAQVLAYDIDRPDIDARELSERLRRRGISYAIHHTISAGFGHGSVRVLIPLARPVDHETYLRFWDQTRAIFYGVEIDVSKRGAESLFFAPRIFAEHREQYFFDAVTDAPCLGASGFRPMADEDRYVREVRESRQKHVTVNKNAYILGLIGVELEEAKGRLLAALRDNAISEPVIDWDAAEHTIVKAWTDGAAQRAEEEARPKFVPSGARDAAERVLKAACADVKKGGSLRAAAYKVGQFIPHVLDESGAVDALTGAWKLASASKTASIDEAVRESLAGIEAGRKAPRGIHDLWKQELTLNSDGLGFHAGEVNIHVCVCQHPELTEVLAFDVRENAPVYRTEPPWFRGEKLAYPRRIVTADRQQIAKWVRDELEVANVSVAASLAAVVDRATKQPGDVLMDYFRGLGRDVGVDLLETALVKYMGAGDTPYVRAVTKRWLIGVVARQFKPGCKMDNMLILVGKQGIGKSTWLRELFPAELQELAFCDDVDVARLDKDQYIKLSRFAVCEVGELATMRRADVETVKALLSQRVSDLRAAYAVLAEKYPHRVVWAGTTNHEEFLRDTTGNRRFWPVKVGGRLRLDTLREERDALWAQAVSAYLRGEPWHLTAAEESLAVIEQEAHEEVDPYLEQVRTKVEQWDPDSKFVDKSERTEAWQLEGDVLVYLRLAQLMSRLGVSIGDRVAQRRISDCLRKLGWMPARHEHEGVKYRVWSRIPCVSQAA